jgi:hypothetical protein
VYEFWIENSNSCQSFHFDTFLASIFSSAASSLRGVRVVLVPELEGKPFGIILETVGAAARTYHLVGTFEFRFLLCHSWRLWR